MAKYIGTYATSGDVQTALDNQELSRPFIAYTTDNDKVYYGPTVDKAEVGDIVVYSVSDDLLHYIKQADYNTTSYPSASYVPVGVVAYPQTDDVISGPTGEITYMGVNWLSKTSPDSGKTTRQVVEWGCGGFNIPELTNYENSGTVITDMNGKANTEIVLNYVTAQTDWKTASAITFANEAGYYPLFECAWRYHTSGTIQGDWYVPAAGQIYYLASNTEELAKLNAGFAAIGADLLDLSITDMGSSNEASADIAWFWARHIFNSRFKYEWQAFFDTRPFCTKLMTRI